MGIREREFTDDRIPITGEEVFPFEGEDFTQQTGDELLDEILAVENAEEGIVDDDTLLREGVVFEDDIARENMENDFQDSTY